MTEPTSPEPTKAEALPDPGLVKLVEALARAQARRDHAADLAARRQPQDRTTDAPIEDRS